LEARCQKMLAGPSTSFRLNEPIRL
jgi:hypothetical protein